MGLNVISFEATDSLQRYARCELAPKLRFAIRQFVDIFYTDDRQLSGVLSKSLKCKKIFLMAQSVLAHRHEIPVSPCFNNYKWIQVQERWQVPSERRRRFKSGGAKPLSLAALQWQVLALRLRSRGSASQTAHRSIVMRRMNFLQTISHWEQSVVPSGDAARRSSAPFR